ncbi:hypothetical protein ACGFZP_12920 [Kitasatospora sp. NPDC048239]|uniref:hypothetical protein n=1 Tax=Kitasatospora sp. NPDC048239 TaxID=3364046 RepID=UPI003710AF90
MTVLEPRVQATRYTVNCMPEDSSPDAHVFEIAVEYRGRDLWAVTRHHQSLGADGQWSWGPEWPPGKPGSREPENDTEWDAYHAARDEWTANHRHDLDTALKLAQEAARHVTVNGLTVQAALDRIAQIRAAE